MNLDGDEYLSALEEPTLKLNGVTFVGRHLSFEEWGKFEAQFERVRGTTKGNQVGDLLRFRGLVRAVCDAVFPKRRWWNPFERRVSSRLIKQPLALQVEFIRRFSTSQASVFRKDADAIAAPTVTKG